MKPRSKKKLFDYLEAEAYRELKSAIMTIVETELEDHGEYDDYYFGKREVLSKILDRMNEVDNALHEEIMNDVDELDQYYQSELSADESSHEQQ